jgi:hypothetical protein
VQNAFGEKSARGRPERGWTRIVTWGTEKLNLKGGQIAGCAWAFRDQVGRGEAS